MIEQNRRAFDAEQIRLMTSAAGNVRDVARQLQTQNPMPTHAEICNAMGEILEIADSANDEEGRAATRKASQKLYVELAVSFPPDPPAPIHIIVQATADVCREYGIEPSPFYRFKTKSIGDHAAEAIADAEASIQMIEDALRSKPTLSANEPDEGQQYVTLDQAAAVVGRSKPTLRRYYDDGDLPDPDVKGGGGRPHEWLWSRLRPELERIFERKLPRRFPGR